MDRDWETQERTTYVTTAGEAFDDLGYTPLPHVICEYALKDLGGSAFKVYIFILRKTKGWGKNQDHLSYSQIRDGCNISSRSTVGKALKELKDKGYVTIIKGDFEVPNKVVLNLDKVFEGWSKNCTTPLVQKMDTQKKDTTNIDSSSNIKEDHVSPL